MLPDPPGEGLLSYSSLSIYIITDIFNKEREMFINHRIENHNGSEVLIVKVPRYFDSEELKSRLDTAAKRSYQRGSTFKVVIDYDYTLKHIASIDNKGMGIFFARFFEISG